MLLQPKVRRQLETRFLFVRSSVSGLTYSSAPIYTLYPSTESSRKTWARPLAEANQWLTRSTRYSLSPALAGNFPQSCQRPVARHQIADARTQVRQQPYFISVSLSMMGQGGLPLRLAHCSTVSARADSILPNCLSFALTWLSFRVASSSTRSQSELESSNSSRMSSSENPSCWARRMKRSLCKSWSL